MDSAAWIFMSNELRRSIVSKFRPWRCFEYSRYSRLYAYEYVFIIFTKIFVSSVFKIFILRPRNPSYDRRYGFHPNNCISLKLSGLCGRKIPQYAILGFNGRSITGILICSIGGTFVFCIC